MRLLRATQVVCLGICINLRIAHTFQDERPKIVRFEDMRYPLAARVQHVQGVVVVKVDVDAGGVVTAATVLSGPRELVPESLKNAQKWRFAPKSPGSLPIVYEFRIEGLCNNPCPSHFIVFPPNLAVITIGEAVIDHY